MKITKRFEDDGSYEWVCPLTELETDAIMAMIDAEDQNDPCKADSPLNWLCVRGNNHTGPHIATGTQEVFAIWD